MDVLKDILICIYAILNIICPTAQGNSVGTSDDVIHVYRNLLENYLPNIRSCHNCSGPVNVDIKCVILALNKIDEILGEFTLVASLTVEWSDKRLIWDPKLTGANSLMFSSKEIWVPPLLLSNPFKELSSLSNEAMPVRAFNNGKLIWNPFGVFNTKCEYNIYNYPNDIQTCYVLFHPAAYLANEVNITTIEGRAKLVDGFQENGEWQLIEAFISTDRVLNISITVITIRIARRPTFFVVNIICPLILISILNCLGFAIPAANGERISYSVSVLLSLTVFMSVVNISIPKTSAPMPVICYYLICVFVGSFLFMLAVVLNTRIYYIDTAIPVTPAFKYVVRLIRCGKGRSWTKNRQQNYDNPRASHMESNDVPANDMQLNSNAITPQADTNWRDVALVLDNICLAISFIYVVIVNIIFVFV